MNLWPCPICGAPIKHHEGHQFDPIGTLHNYTCAGYGAEGECEHGHPISVDCLACRRDKALTDELYSVKA